MYKKSLFALAILGALTFSTNVFAQDNILALENSHQDSLYNADDDILAAMKALDEVGAMIDPDKTADTDNTVDIDALLAAANTPQPAKQADPIAANAELSHIEKTAKAESVAAETETPKPAPEQEVKAVSATEPIAKAKPAESVAAKTETPKPASEQEVKAVSATEPVAKAKPAEKVVAKAETPKKETARPANLAADGTPVTRAKQDSIPTVNPGAAPHTLPMTYVMALYKLNGVDLSKVKSPMPTIAELYQHAFSQKLVYQSTHPSIGDLAFFHNTLDRNRDGRWNDWHTLVGIVESIDKDETISVLIYRQDKIERIHLNLKYPELQKGKKGQELNSQFRANEGAQVGTAAKLFAGFANLLGDATTFTVVDNWKPGMNLSK